MPLTLKCLPQLLLPPLPLPAADRLGRGMC